MSASIRLVLAAALLAAGPALAEKSEIRIKDLGRIDGARDNMISGYGIVSGLAGTGDSARSTATLQSVANTLREFGVAVTPAQLASRNVAAVLVTATLPPFSRSGDKLDVNVSSAADARSLVGGTLLMAPLYGPDRRIYALAQGPLNVGGYKFDLNGNVVQKNHPTSGIIPDGAVVEGGAGTRILREDGSMHILVTDPDYTTASRMALAINRQFGGDLALALDAGRVQVVVPEGERPRLVDFVARLESIGVAPDARARVIVNERTGVVVSGGDVHLSKVSVAHGDLKVTIVTDFLVSQPGGFLIDPGPGIQTQVVPRTRIQATESPTRAVTLGTGATVSELVAALNQVKTTTRDIISILQSIKRAGALHAELVVQ
jgi:flagellar P-ring protein precursor FlgI